MMAPVLVILCLSLLCTMPTKDRDRPKICHCKGDCNRLLGLRQQKHHYQLIDDPSTIRRSTTPSDSGHYISSDDERTDSLKDESMVAMVTDNGGDIAMAELSDDSAERYSMKNDDDAGQECGDGFFDWRDEDDWEFYDDDEVNKSLLSLDEIQEALEDAIGPGKDLEMWNLRK
jgi:hypothetical protein